MLDMFKRAVYLGIGAASMTKEKAEQLVQDLVRRGELSSEEAGDFLEHMVTKAHEVRREMQDTVGREVQKMRRELGLITREDIKRLEDRLAQLEAVLKNQGRTD